jgi:hypothetical protein
VVVYRWLVNCGYRSGDHLDFRELLAQQMGAELERPIYSTCDCKDMFDAFSLGTVYCPRCGFKVTSEKLRQVAQPEDDVDNPQIRGFKDVDERVKP